MSSCYIIISYHISCSLILSLLLIWSPLHSILSYSTSFQIDSIWFYFIFYFIEFDLLYCSVLYVISMNDLCLSVRPSVCLSVCVFICMNKFMFSLLITLHFHFSFFTLFSHEHLPHTHTDTDTQIHMNKCSFLWLVHITSKAGKWRIVFEW